jgi:hypothetical protein
MKTPRETMRLQVRTPDRTCIWRYLLLSATLMLSVGILARGAAAQEMKATLVRSIALPDSEAVNPQAVALFLSDAEDIFVYNVTKSEISRLTPAGRVVYRFGRRGRGPSEFYVISHAIVRGDTLVFADPFQNRLTWVDGTGKAVGTVAFDRPVGMRGSTDAPYLFGSGTMLLDFAPPSPRRGGTSDVALIIKQSTIPVPTVLRLATIPRDGSQVTVGDTIVSIVRKSGPVMANSSKDREFAGSQPWLDGDLLDVASSGDYLAVVQLSDTSNPRRPAYLLTIRSTSGIVAKVRCQYDPLPLEDRTVAAWLSETVTENVAAPFGDTAVARREFAKGLFRPKHLPPVLRLLVARDGTVWLEREAPAVGSRWEIRKSDGRLIGRVTLPKDFRAMAVSRNRVWGLDTNEERSGGIMIFDIGSSSNVSVKGSRFP